MLSQYLQEIESKINDLIIRHQKYSDAKYLIAFRGEKTDYKNTKLMPSLFRDKTYIEKEKYLFELLDDYGFLNKGIDRNIEKAIEAQHYIAISRMLDITFSILPALYFACQPQSEGQNEKGGVVYIFCFPEHYSPHSQYIEQFYSGVLNETEDITYSSNFKVISHSFSNERIKAQVGGFIFFPGKEFRNIPEVYYEKLEIKEEDKEQILKDLDLVFNINKATLFPEKDNIIPIIEKRFKEESYIKREITIEGEINSYFDRLDYELKLEGAMGERRNQDKLVRYLRKEKSDLLFYVDTAYRMNESVRAIDTREAKEEMIKHIEDTFKYLYLKYVGR